MELTIGEQKLTYKMLQFHFHCPSEHLVSGKSYPMELHIVHEIENPPKDYPYKMAVLGIVFDTTNDKKCPFLQSLHLKKSDQSCEVELQKFIEGIPKEIYHYKGSLTTPPCTEIVNW
jgi:carbonic anhydrase